VSKAEARGADDVAALLQENLEQEQHTLGEVQQVAERLSRRAAQQVAR
jgi:ferritin-like metal-binding protein YciE